MARVLLARGADPNFRIFKAVKTTIWEDFLSICAQSIHMESPKFTFQMAELFVRGGANLDVKVRTGSTQRTVTKNKTPMVRTKGSRGASTYQVAISEEVYSGALEILQLVLLQSQYEHIEALIAENHNAKSSFGILSWLGWR